jgi:hypothetical protein
MTIGANFARNEVFDRRAAPAPTFEPRVGIQDELVKKTSLSKSPLP